MGARSTDDLIELGRADAAAEAAGWFDDESVQAVEGMTVPRALRKWLAENPEGKPVDEVHWYGKPFCALTKGQRTIGKGARTVFDEIRPELKRRGVKVVDHGGLDRAAMDRYERW